MEVESLWIALDYLSDRLDWPDVLFFLSGINSGISLTILWSCVDNLNEWNGFAKFFSVTFWFVLSGLLFAGSIHLKNIDNEVKISREVKK